MQMKTPLYGLILLLLAAIVLGAAILPSERPKLYHGSLNGEAPGAKVLDVPFVWQKEWYCSEASASMVLQYYGYDVTQDYVYENMAYNFETMVPPLKQYRPCSYESLNLENLRREIDEGDPVMIRLKIGDYRHTVVIVGYDDDYFYVHDPARGKYLKANPGALQCYWKPTGYLAIVIKS